MTEIDLVLDSGDVASPQFRDGTAAKRGNPVSRPGYIPVTIKKPSRSTANAGDPTALLHLANQRKKAG